MGLLSHKLKMKDSWVGFIAGISQLASCFVYAYANTSLLMYLGEFKSLEKVSFYNTDRGYTIFIYISKQHQLWAFFMVQLIP